MDGAAQNSTFFAFPSFSACFRMTQIGQVKKTPVAPPFKSPRNHFDPEGGMIRLWSNWFGISVPSMGVSFSIRYIIRCRLRDLSVNGSIRSGDAEANMLRTLCQWGSRL